MNELLRNINAYYFKMQHNKVLFRSSYENSCIFSFRNIYRRGKKKKARSVFSNIMQPYITPTCDIIDHHCFLLPLLAVLANLVVVIKLIINQSYKQFSTFL